MKNYWREEFALIAVLLFSSRGIIDFALPCRSTRRLFPMVIGIAGIVLVA